MAAKTSGNKKLSAQKKDQKTKTSQKKAPQNIKTAPKKTTAAKGAAKKQSKTDQTYRLNAGDSVPDFRISSTSGQDFRLKDKAGKVIIIYFYPKDATPGCTLEGHDFTKLHPEFVQRGVEVYGISRDSLPSHQKFIEKQGYCFDFLSDTDEKVCKIFDVIQEKNMYGKKMMGIERSTFVIGKKSQVLKEWRKVKVEGHAQEVLEFIKGL